MLTIDPTHVGGLGAKPEVSSAKILGSFGLGVIGQPLVRSRRGIGIFEFTTLPKPASIGSPRALLDQQVEHLVLHSAAHDAVIKLA